MTTEQMKSLRDAIEAHLRGQKVQFETDMGTWIDSDAPSFSSAYHWRPQPKELTRQFKRWAVLTPDGAFTNSWDNKQSAEADAKRIGGQLVELVEASRQHYDKEPMRFWGLISKNGHVFHGNSKEEAEKAALAIGGRVTEFVEVVP